MKISIGNHKDKRIKEVIQKNMENGYSIYFDGEHFYVDVLTDGLVYRAPDIIQLENQQQNKQD